LSLAGAAAGDVEQSTGYEQEHHSNAVCLGWRHP